MNLDAFKEYAASLIRTFLTPVTIYLAQAGYITESQATQLGIIIASLIVTALWSLGNKYLWGQKVDVALTLPGGSSMQKLNEVLKSK